MDGNAVYRAARTTPSAAVVRELDGDSQFALAHERDHLLQVVLVLARHPHLLVLDRRLDPQLGVLDEAHDLLGLLHRDALLQPDALTAGAAGGRLDLA